MWVFGFSQTWVWLKSWKRCNKQKIHLHIDSDASTGPNIHVIGCCPEW